MHSIEVTIHGAKYPLRMSMGAMLRFKNLTGKEINDVDMTALSELATVFYCCVASACKAEGRPFDFSLEEFCDNITLDEMNAMSAIFEGSEVNEGEKKSL